MRIEDFLNMIHQGDCLEIMKDIPDGSVDLVLCDLPYGITVNKWDSEIPLEPLWEQYLRIGKQNAVFLFTASQPFTSTLVMSQLKLFRHEWIWIKNRGSNFANTVREPMKEHESVLMFSRGKWTYNKQLQPRTGGGIALAGATQKDKGGKSDNYNSFTGKDIKLSDLRVPSSWQKFNTQAGLHPTQKPVDLFRYLIRTYTNPDDTVLDNCIGSGTTAIAALQEDRNFIGIEMEPKYAEASLQRISDYLDQLED